jgi:prepilin-type N-terminal cleavage/methylation domain-containing protein
MVTKALLGRFGTRKAFTLIELLIVVAIISILATIALPNFLEAQIRARVSRAKADMRSIATAIETHRVDHTRYECAGGPAYIKGSNLNHLTTPIAYMTTVPPDPFLQDDQNYFGMRTFLYTPDWFRGTVSGGAETTFFYPPREGYSWVLISVGPDGDWECARKVLDPENYGGDTLYYDSTNGTLANGDIYLYGPGGSFNP